ncbi:protein LNK1 [Selaginella moellendorffii]|uniref:protein LNK1 n=1 Tax=Selaginella moellendorffii TaxID=88036 RepID=UPI000D1C8B56|nr:protein LNK1 [Selaginella moellendorffii]|eukprot:XP_024529002.1 protein LNK1 [Selaginella moellendorffii]
MTDFESKGGHEHIRGRGFEALDTKSTWSSFDEIAWDDFGGDDHSVPEPDERAPSLWLRRKKDPKLWKELKEEEQTSKMDAEATTMDVDSWDSLNVGELGAVPDNLTGIGNHLKEESPDALPLLDGGVVMCLNEYNDGDAGHFAFSAVPSEEEMTLFGGESDAGKGSALLSYAWENLEDMDNLFQSEEAPFSQDATDALLQWPASSSSPDSNSPVTNAKAACASPELRAMKGKSHDQDMKMEFIPCESFDKNSDACASIADGESAATDLSTAELKFAAHEEQRGDIDKTPAEDSMEPLLSPKGKQQVSDTDKAHPGKRQASNRKRSDERSRKQIYPKRPGISYAKQQPSTQFSSSQPLQLKPTVASTLQVYPHVTGPAVLGTMHHRPQYIGPVHHSSYMIQPAQSQHSQAVMMCYDQAEQQRFGQETRQKLAPPPPPSLSGTNMTPQEKIEKLRWKQKMHRLASEQHQQMAKQCGLSMDPCTPQQGARSETPIDADDKANVKSEDGDGARATVVDSAVVSQLLGIMSKLDVGTRICIRDALYRLARSAITRHTSDGPSSSEGSNNSAGDNSLSRAIRYPLLETETNPIDRTIANLLFHKRSSSNSANNSNSSNNSTGSAVNIPCLQENQAPWTWQQQQQQHQQQEAGLSQQQQQQQELPSSELTAPEEKSLRDDCSSEIAEEASDGSKKGAKPGGGVGYFQSVKSHRKREASSSEFLSNEEGESPRIGRGACSSSSDSSRGHGKAAKTGIQ